MHLNYYPAEFTVIAH